MHDLETFQLSMKTNISKMQEFLRCLMLITSTVTLLKVVWATIKTKTPQRKKHHVPLSVLGVSSHLFLRALGVALCPGVAWPGVAWPGVAWPGVTWPGVKWAGVFSQTRVLALGVAPGVSLPFALPGVSSQRLMDGVEACCCRDEVINLFIHCCNV